MIQSAFPAKYWNNTTQKVVYDANGNPSFLPGAADPLNTNEYTQMEANFSFFFGIALQMYQATLVANDSKVDKFIDGSGALTNEEQLGMAVFADEGNCMVCHGGGTLMDIDTALYPGRRPERSSRFPSIRTPCSPMSLCRSPRASASMTPASTIPGCAPAVIPQPRHSTYLAVNEDVGRGGMTGLGGGFTEVSLSKGILGLQKIGGPTPANARAGAVAPAI